MPQLKKINKINLDSIKNLFRLFVLIIISIGLTACSGGSKTRLYKNLSKEDPKNVYYQGHYKIGKEYKIKGTTYKPKEDVNYSQVGVASWYGSKDGFHGKKTANGDRYNKHLLTAAHRHLPMPSLVKVTNLSNNKSLIVLINDRGPFSKNRIIDVSEKAADVLGFKRQGVAKVKVQYMKKETQEFLHNIALKPKENSTAKKKVATETCSVNCHIKLVNMKHKLAFAP
ncbi:MAG: septal ring lytic transglycosylase RlpA family protein [Candidatus Rickettsia vulgarisii]